MLGLIEKRADNLRCACPFLHVAREAYERHEISHVILDTPGQIEIFTWSASGAIITDAVASSFPTVVAYIIDTPRTTAPATFMSNMLYACSILYKTKLPFILVFNKTDVERHDFALEWMTDFEAFQAALASHANSRDSEGEPTYMNSLMNSMSLVLDEFYKHLKAVGVSSVTGDGMKEFFEAVEASREEYEKYAVLSPSDSVMSFLTCHLQRLPSRAGTGQEREGGPIERYEGRLDATHDGRSCS